jgi:hypothetical protein
MDMSGFFSNLVNSAKQTVFSAYNLYHGLDPRGLVRVRPDGTLPSGIVRGQVIVAQDGSVRRCDLTCRWHTETRMATQEDISNWRKRRREPSEPPAADEEGPASVSQNLSSVNLDPDRPRKKRYFTKE